jgi:membrane-bound lytic murein transglycosylase D
VLHIDLEELKLLNPQYKRWVIPAYNEPYPLRLKNTDIVRFIELQDSIYAYKYAEFFTPMKVYEGLFTGIPVSSTDYNKVYHIVKQGETLATIAGKYGLSVYEIKKMNNLSSNAVKSKQKLLVGYEYVKSPPKSNTPLQDSIQASIQSANSQAETQKQNAGTSQNNSTVYIVQKGDSLSSIAAKYKTTARKIADDNRLPNMNTLSIGQKLLILQK